jgi:stage II sporulation protein D
MTRKLPALTLALLAGALASAPCANAAKAKITIRGAGFGHGVGMSQYGAMGFALHGYTAPQILAHYYTGTSLGTSDPKRTVRVLLDDQVGSAKLSGAVQAGDRKLDPGVTYTVKRRGLSQVDLSASGKHLATFNAPLQVAGSNGITDLGGRGYRGILEISPGLFGGVQVINSVNIEDYLQGVVPSESPASWPAAALQAQAIAARTYAITTAKASGPFDEYADTRSQVYGGVAAETPATNQAVADTRGQVVTYGGQPVVTFFFSTSGGRTENVENTNLGTQPEPWLKSVDDPYDSVSPRHRWTPVTTSLAAVGRKLAGLYQGSFRGIKVLQRGASPRIMKAQVIGSRGSTVTDGATLRDKLGLFDDWAYFTSVSTKATGGTMDGSGGVQAHGSRVRRAALSGSVIGAGTGSVVVQRRIGGGWWDVGTARLRHGAYRWSVREAGTYRIVAGGAPGPDVRAA